MRDAVTENSTRQRLIQAAGELFAEKGFKETTVRDISEKAGANLAAVNYHFGDKERLYEAVLLYIINNIKDEFPVEKGVEEAPSNEAKLRTFVRNMLFRFADPGRPAWQGVILAQERMNPRPRIMSVIHEEIMKTVTILATIITDQLGEGADVTEIDLCATSVMGQLMFHAHVRSPYAPPLVRREPFTAEEIENAADHIARFSLAGMEKIGSARKEKQE